MLKYVPAMLCGLLVVAWVASVGHEASINWHRAARTYCVGLSRGNLYFESVAGWYRKWFDVRQIPAESAGGNSIVGQLQLVTEKAYPEIDDWWCTSPILLSLTICLPFAIAFAAHFRFPLWSYFAWIALIAAELAYYMR